MRIYEGFWDGVGLALWAMDSELPALTNSRKRVRPHPYALEHDALIPEMDGALGTSELLLPARSPRHPLPPPNMPPFPDAPAKSTPSLRRWTVPTLHLSTEETLTALRTLGEGSGDVVPGTSLRHFTAIAEAASRLVDTQCVIPQLVDEVTGDEARWRPVLEPRATSWLNKAVRTLPAVARAHQPADASPEEAGLFAMGDVLTALCAFTDLQMRTRLAGAVSPPKGPHPKLRDQWLHALTDTSGAVSVRPTQRRTMEQLTWSLRTWFAEAHTGSGEIRLTVRLVDPPEPDLELEETAPDWTLELWVQSTTEPSLMITLADLWAGEAAEWLPHGAQDEVVRALGRAARIYPELSRALNEAAPTHLQLDLDGAYAFLTTHAPELGAAGFGVLLPKWAGERRVGLKATARSHSPSPSSSSSSSGGATTAGENLIEFDYRVAVGDTELSETELAELARLKQPLVRLRGEWVKLDPKTLRAAAQFLKNRTGNGVDIREALRLAISPEVDTGDGALPVTAVDAEGRLGELLDGAAAQHLTPLEEPAGFTAQLRPYQRRGASWLQFLDSFGLGAVLADDMGLGKTLQLLALLATERQHGGEPAPTLIICPVSLIGNWHREAERFAPGLSIHVHHGPDRPRGEALAAAVDKADLVLTSYSLALRDAEGLAGLSWGRVVCDEAQAIKNPGTRQARAVRAIPAPSRIALTGTPVENHLGELWSIMEFTNPGLLGSQQGFRKSLAAPIETAAGAGEETPQAADARKRLGRITGPFVLRRLKTDTSIISDLPEKHEMKTWCTLTREQASLYQATVDEMTALVDQAEGIQRHGLVLATMTKLKQVCNHPAHLLGDGSRLDGRSGKLEMVCELLDGMQNEKALCFTQYTDFGDRLAPYLAARLNTRVLWLHGGTPRAQREEMVREFQESDEPMIFLLSLRAGGTGLNLTAANHVVHFDRWWNPAVENQATDRAFRIGQQRTVQVRKMICMGTMEERIDAMMERKSALAESVVGSGEDWLGELSSDELREVVRLAPEAVEG